MSVAAKPSMLRRYLYEYAILTLAGCVAYLFYANAELNSDFRKYLLDDRPVMIRAIEQNTSAINDFNRKIMQEISKRNLDPGGL